MSTPLWLRTVVFTLLVPGTVLGVIPFALTEGGYGPHLQLGGMHWLGFVLLAPGCAIILSCFADFVRRGRGTPAPYDPPRQLVITGLYQYVRNPQYLGVLLVCMGQAVLTGRVILLGYAMVLGIVYHLFVRFYEEPTLKRKFGEAYLRYCDEVPRWLPKLVTRRGV